MLKLMAKG